MLNSNLEEFVSYLLAAPRSLRQNGLPTPIPRRIGSCPGPASREAGNRRC